MVSKEFPTHLSKWLQLTFTVNVDVVLVTDDVDEVLLDRRENLAFSLRPLNVHGIADASNLSSFENERVSR